LAEINVQHTRRAQANEVLAVAKVLKKVGILGMCEEALLLKQRRF
jgi:hypothetical protein